MEQCGVERQDTEKELEMMRNASLELLALVNSVCQKHGLRYTLFGNSILDAMSRNGFGDDGHIVSIAMFYDDYRKFIEFFRGEHDESSGYYLLDHDNCEQFDSVMAKVMKRSRVTLPADRRADQVYYDYCLDVYPVFYAGDTEADVSGLQEKYAFFVACLNTRDPGSLKGYYSLMRVFRTLRRRARNFYYRIRMKKHSDIYAEMLALLRRNAKPTKYAFVPSTIKRDISYYDAENYNSPSEIEFEGIPTFIPAKAEKLAPGFAPTYNSKRSAAPISREFLRRVQMIELEMLAEFDRICRKHNLKYILAFGTLLGAVRHRGFIPWDDDVDVIMPYEDSLRFAEVAKIELDHEKYFLKTQESDSDNNLTFPQIKRNGTVYCRRNRQNFKTHLGLFIDIFVIFPGSPSRILHFLQTKIARFYKSALWSHMYFDRDTREGFTLKRFYYSLLSRIPPKKAYAEYIKYATLFSSKNNKLSYLNHTRNPFDFAVTQHDIFEDRVELDFEGYSFYAPRNYDCFLSWGYGNDYLRYPGMSARYPPYGAAAASIGDLYAYD